MVYKNSRENSGNICNSHDKHEQKSFLLGLSRNFLDIPQNIPIKLDNICLGTVTFNERVHGALEIFHSNNSL